MSRVATTKVNNPRSKLHGKRLYKRPKFRIRFNGKWYYRFGKCTLPAHVLKFLK